MHSEIALVGRMHINHEIDDGHLDSVPRPVAAISNRLSRPLIYSDIDSCIKHAR